jgi:hypothetical protein
MSQPAKTLIGDSKTGFVWVSGMLAFYSQNQFR